LPERPRAAPVLPSEIGRAGPEPVSRKRRPRRSVPPARSVSLSVPPATPSGRASASTSRTMAGSPGAPPARSGRSPPPSCSWSIGRGPPRPPSTPAPVDANPRVPASIAPQLRRAPKSAPPPGS